MGMRRQQRVDDATGAMGNTRVPFDGDRKGPSRRPGGPASPLWRPDSGIPMADSDPTGLFVALRGFPRHD
jgi:hypothetical protein